MSYPPANHSNQKGATLIELLVGISIGLLTVAVGLGAIMVSRGVSGTVSDASQLQQQASYAFRVIGQQIKQSGGRPLDPNTDPRDPVVFIPAGVALTSTTPVTGKDSPASTEFNISIRYQNSSEPVLAANPASAAVSGYLSRDCLGENPGVGTYPLITSQFRRNTASNTLECAGSGGAQPIISGVTDFQIRYLQQALDATLQPRLRYSSATGLSTGPDWSNIYGVEVCLEIEGQEVVNTLGSTYTKCDGSTADRGNRIRMVFKNIFYIRNHGWPASAA